MPLRKVSLKVSLNPDTVSFQILLFVQHNLSFVETYYPYRWIDVPNISHLLTLYKLL